MELTIFAKERMSKDGKKFTSYITQLTKKSGEKETVSVNFREECIGPKKEQCPCNIIVAKKNCNLAVKTVTDENGIKLIYKTLWIQKEWEFGEEYIDHSMDEYL